MYVCSYVPMDAEGGRGAAALSCLFLVAICNFRGPCYDSVRTEEIGSGSLRCVIRYRPPSRKLLFRRSERIPGEEPLGQDKAIDDRWNLESEV